MRPTIALLVLAFSLAGCAGLAWYPENSAGTKAAKTLVRIPLALATFGISEVGIAASKLDREWKLAASKRERSWRLWTERELRALDELKKKALDARSEAERDTYLRLHAQKAAWIQAELARKHADEAARAAAALAIYGASLRSRPAFTPQRTVRCTSYVVGNIVQTHCY